MKGKVDFRLAGSMLALAIATLPGCPALAQDTGQAANEQSQAGTQSSPGSQGQAVTNNQANRQENAPQPGDIVVTANKREERLNDVAAAVSAFTAEDRTIRGINSTQDVAKFTPGVSISDTPNRVNIRGVGRVTNALGSDPGVANYVDGFYTSESDVIGSSDFLTERVEILRGPQGTLYGRNSIGGAVNIVSKRPTTDYVVEGRAGISDYQNYLAGASLSGPISDSLRFRIAAIGTTQGKGYVKNLAGPDQYTDREYTVEGQLEADVTSNLNVWVRAQHTRYDRRPQPATTIDQYANVPYFGGLVANPTYGVNNVSVGDPYTVAYDNGGRQQLDGNYSVTTNVTLNTRDVIVRYIGGYSQYDYLQTRDYDQTARKSFNAPGFGTTFPVSTNYVERVGENKHWNSSELDFLSTPGGQLDWIIGFYYYHETLDQPYDIEVPDVALFEHPVSLADVPTINNPRRSYYSQRGQLSATSLATFGQLTWRFAPHVSIDLGARYSDDQKRGREDQFQVFYNVQVDPGHTYGVLNAGRNLRGDWGAFSGAATLNFKPTDQTLAYAKVSRGYKSGGFSLGALAAVPEVAAEHLTAYEVGLKQGIGPLQVNSALFYNDYTDQQVPVSVQTAPGVVIPILVNVPKSRSYGFETEATIRPVRPLTLSAIYSYLNATYRDFSGVIDPASANGAPQNLRGEDLPQSPRNRLTLNGVLTAGPFDFSASQSFVDSQYYQVFNTDRYRAPAYQDTALTLTWTAPHERFRLIGSVTNVFDNTSYSYITATAYSAGALRSVTPRLPRVFSLQGRVKF